MKKIKARIHRPSDADAFLRDPPRNGSRRVRDDLAEELAEDFLSSATSAEKVYLQNRDSSVPEDDGGPFVVTRAKVEFARGTDKSNPKDALREPFPLVNGAPKATKRFP